MTGPMTARGPNGSKAMMPIHARQAAGQGLIVRHQNVSPSDIWQGSQLHFRLVGHPLPRPWCRKLELGGPGGVGKQFVAQRVARPSNGQR